jgi:hypothetical protein
MCQPDRQRLCAAEQMVSQGRPNFAACPTYHPQEALMKNAIDDVPMLAKIVTLLTQEADMLTQQRIYMTMKEHYQTLGLMDGDGQWVSPELALISHQLLPSSVSLADVHAFLHKIGINLAKNQYFVRFANSLGSVRLTVLPEKIRQDRNKVIPDVVCYAMMLENLSAACANDYRIFQECFRLLSGALGREQYFRNLTFFTKLKLLSVETPLRARFACHEKGRVPPTSGRLSISINILEATCADWIQGNAGNASAGLVLARNHCGLKLTDPRTGAGPTVFSRDGRTIERAYPFPLEWASLYQTWNMCFCARFRQFPYFVSKLLIPSVSGYFDRPKEYIHHRVIALYFTLIFVARHLMLADKLGKPALDWHDRELMSYWGNINAECAREYSRLVANARKR